MGLKQLGNLAIVCAQRPDMLLILMDGKVSIHEAGGYGQEAMEAPWDDDAAVSKMVYELNFGKFAVEKGA